MQASSLTLNLRTSSHLSEAEHSFFLVLNLNILKQLSDGFSRGKQFVMQFAAQGTESVQVVGGWGIFFCVGVFIFSEWHWPFNR